MAASFFMLAAAILFWPDPLLRIRPALATKMVLAALAMAACISLRPYFGLAAILLLLWYVLVSGPWRPMRLLLLLLAWIGLLSAVGFLLNGLMFIVSGDLETFKAGLQILSQRLIRSDLQDRTSRQIMDTIGVSNLVFLSFGSCLLAPLGFVLTRNTRPHHEKSNPLNRHGLALDIAFASVLLPLSIEFLILKKHYYPHYMQFFAPFGALSIGIVLLLCRDHLPQLSKRLIGSLSLLATVAAIGLMRIEIFSSIKSLSQPLLDRRSAEYATLTSDSKAMRELRKGFLYPESMSLHWKLVMSRQGFPNTYNSQLSAGGAWKDVTIPAIYRDRIATTADTFCTNL
ncbi:MAG: hypothetical protein VKK03_07120, partial [Synechococcus sp.]|nr:hypothetical protein [Synechococcus sp.]